MTDYRKDFPLLRQSDVTYLDNAATTLRKPPCVIDAVVQAMQTMGNSGRSAHAESLAAARTIFAAREALAALFGCPQPDHVCLTANSTEALNIDGAGRAGGLPARRPAGADQLRGL